ncbi:MAG: hypothetical protein AB7I50_18800 [Vicinamibacterales bacterium]
MRRRLAVGLACTAALVFSVSALVFTQPPPAQPYLVKDFKWEPWNNPGLTRGVVNDPNDGPAPKRDLAGHWDTARAGIGARGARNPAPLTEWGMKVSATHKSGDGVRMVPAPEINDPLSTVGDPGGYPRNLLFELRQVRFIPLKDAMVALHMWEMRWRMIWTDGRQLPTKDIEPRWYGYAVGRWEDDYTFVVNGNGTDERTWLDNAGNPHSDELKVEERWRRVSQNRIELTVTLDDPKAYTKPWVALDKMVFHKIPDNVDLLEMMNPASEVQAVAEAFKKGSDK